MEDKKEFDAMLREIENDSQEKIQKKSSNY